MTPFETTVLVVCVLLAVTNTAGFAHHPRLKDMPFWYIGAVVTLAVVAAFSAVNTVIGALQ